MTNLNFLLKNIDKLLAGLAGVRDIQIQDSIVFYNTDEVELARIFLESYDEGFIGFIKSDLQRDIGIAEDGLIIVIEPCDVKLKE